MSQSMFELLWFQLRKIRLDIMNYPVNSPERTKKINDAREIEKRLTTAIVSA